MKKIITFLISILSCGFAFAQYPMMNNVASTASGNYISMEVSGKCGGIQISTNSAFNGSTTTAVLQASNDGSTWSQVYQDDNTTACSFTLSSGANSYVWQIKATCYDYYRIVYTKGDATLGNVNAYLTIH